MEDTSIQLKVDANMETLLVETVLQDFASAQEARTKKTYSNDSKGVAYTFETKLQALKDMWQGKRAIKTIPWSNCSNRSMKIAMAILEMMHARMFSAVWNEDLVRWAPTEITDKAKVERINKIMFWWIKVHTKMRIFFDKWTKVVSGMGDALVEVSWQKKIRDTGKIRETPITDEFGVQLFNPDGTPSSTKEKIFKIDEYTQTEIIPKENVYFKEGQKSLDEDPVIIKLNYFYSDLEDMEREDRAVNITKKLNEGSVIEPLKKQLEDKLAIQYSDSNNSNVEILKQVKLRNTPIDILKWYGKIDIDDDGFPEDVRILVDIERRLYLGGVKVIDISKRGIRPLDFTKFNDFLNSPDELEGLGILETVKDLADEIDAIFNQLTDANTLSVLRPGFYDPSGQLQPQTIKISPAILTPVSDPQRNVYFPDFQIPTERLLVAMKAVMEFIERLTGASSYIMGKESEIVGGSGTATRTQAIVMAAEQRFSIPAQRLRDGITRILNIVLDQVQKFIPPGLETRVLGEGGEPLFKSNELTEEGISAELDCYLIPDPSMGSKNTEREIASLFYQMLLQNPLVGTDPLKIYKVTADLIKSYDKNPEEILGPAPDPKDFDTPEQENTLIIQGEFTKVKPILTENHMEHIMKHQELLQSPTLLTIPIPSAQQIVQYAQLHIQEHTMMLQQMIQIQSQYKGGQGGQSGANPSAQGNVPEQGVENLPGPIGQMARRKGEGQSEFSPSGQPA